MSQVPVLIDAVVALARADAVLSEAEVLDGPQVTESGAADWVLVGYDGDPGGDFQAASTAQDWAGLSTRRGERITLTVALVASRGDTDVRAARERVYTLGERLESLLRANPSLGLGAAQVAVDSTVLHQEQTAQGVQARLILGLGCETFS